MEVKNIWGSKINVDGKPLEKDESMVVEKTNEVKKLIKYGYLFVTK